MSSQEPSITSTTIELSLRSLIFSIPLYKTSKMPKWEKRGCARGRQRSIDSSRLTRIRTWNWAGPKEEMELKVLMVRELGVDEGIGVSLG